MSASDSQWSGRELHFIAIGGAGMSGLALIASELGARVTGSDRSESSYLRRLRGAGLDPQVGHDPELVPPGAEVVISTAIAADNVELVRARERGQRVLHRGKLLAEVCGLRRLIGVSGTHGKTTTSGMIAWTLRELGADPGFVIGGDLPGRGEAEPTNAALGGFEWMVAEADESDGSFLELSPEIAVVTNVELDHHSHWHSRAELTEAFVRFCEPARSLVVHADGSLDQLVGNGSTRVARYPLAGQPAPSLSIPGTHNRENALAAIAAIELVGEGRWGREAIEAAIASFPGMARRLELRGRIDGATIYDDYAHHPTEVAASLQALRELEPERLMVVFQPHLYSRTKALAADFGAALAAADVIGVVDVYAAREQPTGTLAGVSGLMVAAAAADRAEGRAVLWLGSLAAAERIIGPRLGDGDLLVTMGAGDVHTLAEGLLEGAAP